MADIEKKMSGIVTALKSGNSIQLIVPKSIQRELEICPRDRLLIEVRNTGETKKVKRLDEETGKEAKVDAVVFECQKCKEKMYITKKMKTTAYALSESPLYFFWFLDWVSKPDSWLCDFILTNVSWRLEKLVGPLDDICFFRLINTSE